MQSPNLLIAEMPYLGTLKSPISTGNRDCAACHDVRGHDQASKADYTCIEGDQHLPMCLGHAQEWADSRGLKLPVLARRAGA